MEQTIARYRAQLRNSPDAEPIQVLARTQGGKGVVATLNQREVPDAALFEGPVYPLAARVAVPAQLQTWTRNKGRSRRGSHE